MACLFFGAISGSGPATTAAVGMLMIPAMTKRNYDRAYASAVTAASGGLGIIIPPSIPMVIFGIAALGMEPPAEAVEKFGSFASLSIPKLFIAGVIPGLVMAASLLVMNYFISKKSGYRGLSENWSGGDLMAALKRGVWSILAPVIILGGIYAGIFTPTESAIVAIFYTLFIGWFVHRELRWIAIKVSLRTTTWITGRVLLILFTATAFGRLLVEQRIPSDIAEAMLGLTTNTYLIWAMVIVFLLFVGMFMETLAAILILVPVLLPVMYMTGADPTHVGIVVICTLAIGFMTPPLGENLFVASGIGGEPVEKIIVRVMPFVLVAIVAVFLIAYVPQISLWLPSMVGY
jgi:C4-dicarboxylate transporter DctM subunit